MLQALKYSITDKSKIGFMAFRLVSGVPLNLYRELGSVNLAIDQRFYGSNNGESPVVREEHKR